MGPGLLKFKGDKVKKKKRGSVKHSPSSSSKSSSSSTLASSPSSRTTTATSDVPTQQDGTGLITTTTTVVHGVGTCFLKELNVGDAILVVNTTTRKPEMRVIKMVLSDVSIGISSAFTEDCKTPTSFSYINRPKSKELEEMRMKKEASRAEETTSKASGVGSGGTMTYQVKNAGHAYKTITENVGKGASREDMLRIRTSKKSDKYC